MHLFERIHFFLQRLSRYVGLPLTENLTELLGKIMAQLLSILALSMKAMTDRPISQLNHSLYLPLLADYGSEKLLKKLVGRTEVEDALSHLDTLTKEENLMILARNLEMTHRVDGNVEATKVLSEDIDTNVKATKVLTKDVSDNVKLIDLHVRVVTDELKRLSFSNGAVLDVEAETHLQETSYKKNSEHGSLLQILPSTITLLAKFSITVLRRGLFTGVYSENGCRTPVPSCGFVAIVRISAFPICTTVNPFPNFRSRSGKKYSMVRVLTSVSLTGRSRSR